MTANPIQSDYIKVESMQGDRKWKILVFPNMTVRDLIAKLSKRVDEKFKFFELLQVYEDKQGMWMECVGEVKLIPPSFYFFSHCFMILC
jgi:hypothetical protein